MNQRNVKIENRSNILKILRNQRDISRKDISDQLGLTKAAVSSIISDMIDENLIVETGNQETGLVGRNKILLELNKDYGFVLGLLIAETYITLLVTNVMGETVDMYVHELAQDESVNIDETIEMIVDKALYLLWTNGIERKSVLGIGIGYIGEMDSINIDYIKSQISNRLNLTAVMSNNVKALAMMQMDFSSRETSENFLFVKYGPGLGMAIVQGGKIIEGSDHKAGEIGHTIVDMDADTSCRCGRKGCLESLISEKGIVKDIEKLGTKYSHLIINKNLSMIDYTSVNELLEIKDEPITSIFEQRYDYFAKSLANTIILLNPDYVCVYGVIFSQPKIFKMINSRVNDYLGANTKAVIRLSNLDPNSSAIGPAALALRKLFYNVGGYREYTQRDKLIN
ncbi:ROK family transcriptional regulator [Bacillus salinus]|uniref:ROK family transcriptional regulator n=1 Tax=Bacillus sp. HMF5848 TaxID=2495421 RepID=UPI00163A2BA2|nr:ROK family transcriptional regulator [Bacillus sp. HMF5848]